MRNVTATCKGRFLKIFIDDLLHIAAEHVTLIGIQSYIVSKDWFKIEIYLKDRIIVCEYDDFDLWKKILILLNENVK